MYLSPVELKKASFLKLKYCQIVAVREMFTTQLTAERVKNDVFESFYSGGKQFEPQLNEICVQIEMKES